ncbi:MAG: AAA family ATPase [Deltaproteobacteria bacterium]|nr:AAA family ATPase [Deltaproteobacteria bacterium]
MTVLAVQEPSLVVLCGPAGCGKSTFAARWFRETEVLCADTVRGWLCDNPAEQGINESVFEVLHRIAELRLANGRLTVIDATNLEASARLPLRQLARRARLPSHLIVISADLETIRERNQRRDRRVDDGVLRGHLHMVEHLDAALEKERWGRIDRIDAQQLESAEVVRTTLPPVRFEEEGPFDVVGDVHGCLSELDTLVRELGYDEDGEHPEGRRLVFVGDLVDRGPDSVGVLRRVLPWVEQGRALFVPGNHDDKLARWLHGRAVKVTGGLATTVGEWQQLSAPEERLLRRRFLAVMKEAPHYLWLDGGRLLVSHAGLEERDHGRTGDAVSAFCLFGKTTGKVIDGYPERLDWAADYEGAAYVAHGHVPVRLPQWRNRVADIDLGVVFGGDLCAMRWPEKTFVTVPAEKAWWGGGRWGAAEPADTMTPSDEATAG